MIIKTGDYVETKNGKIGVVRTVGKAADKDSAEQFVFDWEITHPAIRNGGNCAFFSGNVNELWDIFNRVGAYTDPMMPFQQRKPDRKKSTIKPLTLVKKETVKGWRVTCETDNSQTAEYGEYNVLVPDIPDNAELALKINEIINHLNSEGR